MRRYKMICLLGSIFVLSFVISACQVLGQDPETIIASNTEDITTSLRRLQEEGGDGNFAVFLADEAKNYYIQFIGEPGDNVLYAEAVSNNFLNAEDALTEAQSAQLSALGWSAPDDVNSPNFYRSWLVRSEEDRAYIAGEVLRIFEDVYGVPAGQRIKIELVLE